MTKFYAIGPTLKNPKGAMAIEREHITTIVPQSFGQKIALNEPHYPVPAIDNPCFRDYARGDLTFMGLVVSL